MIQFNLLPDVKLEYLRAERARRLVIGISIIVSAVAVALLLALVVTTSLQRKRLTNLTATIKSESKKIEGQPDLNKILTIQNQLSSLTTLHQGKPAVSRLGDYLSETTPANANINNLTIDFNQHQMTITGTADSLATVNQYVDTLKFTTYSDDSTKNQPAFSNVVLSSFGVTQHEADYTITLSYDPNIFDITQNVKLTVPPNKVTTRSALEQPTNLFKLPIDKPAGTANTGGQ